MPIPKNLPAKLGLSPLPGVSGLVLITALSSVRGAFAVRETGETPPAYVVYVDGRRPAGDALTFPRAADAERVCDECRATFAALRGV